MLKDYLTFSQSNKHFLSFGLLTAFIGNFGQTFFIAFYGGSIRESFALSSGDYGTLYSMATLTSGFLILYAGALLDKIPLKKFTTLTCIGLTLGCLGMYFSQSVWLLAVALFLLRFCGQGLMFHIAFTSMARYFDKNRGKAIGIVGMGMPLGEAILPIAVVLLTNAIGWRESWLILGVVVVIYIPTISYLLNHAQTRLQNEVEIPTQESKNSTPSWTRAEVAKDHQFWALLPAIMAPAFIVTGIFIHQDVLLSNKGWDKAWFTIAFIPFALFHFKSSIVTGSLVDKFSGKKLIRFYLAPLLLSVLLLALPLSQSYITILFMSLLGISIGASGPIVGSLWVEVYGKENLGAIRSLVTSIMVFSTAISPILFGWLFDIGVSYENVMLMLVAYLFSAIFLVWILFRRQSTED